MAAANDTKAQAIKRLQKEIAALAKEPLDGVTAGPCGDDHFKWEGTMTGPAGTPYEGGVFFFSIHFPSDYPFKPPVFRCTTKIYHCNLQDNSSLDQPRKDEYSPALTVRTILSVIKEMFAKPNPDAPINAAIAEHYKTDKAAHDKTAAEWTRKYAM